MAVAGDVAVSGGGAVAVAGLTRRFFNHIQKDFLINVWVYMCFCVFENPKDSSGCPCWAFCPYRVPSWIPLSLTSLALPYELLSLVACFE